MRVKTVQINWHDKLPIFSVDVDRAWNSVNNNSKGWRFATGGGDNNVRIWRLLEPAERKVNQPPVEFLASLNRHTAPVNVVRFSPCSSYLASAGDDGVIIIWKEQQQGQSEGKGEGGLTTLDSDDFVEPETWRPVSMLRGSLADICDLAWSPCGQFIVSASVDNTARIWDAAGARCLQVLADHTHYVQGVAWDPLGEFIITQACDRSVRIYRWISSNQQPGAGSRDGTALAIKPGTDVVSLVAAHYSMAVPGKQQQPPESGSGSSKEGEGGGPRSSRELEQAPGSCEAPGAGPITTGPKTQRLFHDDNLASFFRRPSISPDGRLFATAAGIQKTGGGEGSRNTCYLWGRDKLQDEPVMKLSGHPRPVVVAKWAPCKFDPIPADRESGTKRADDAIRPPGWLAPAAGVDGGEGSAGERMMLAVASQSTVAIYDTAAPERALGLMSGLHYATITDLAWTPDGSHLIIASVDGFASIASIDQPSAAKAGTFAVTPPSSEQPNPHLVQQQQSKCTNRSSAEEAAHSADLAAPSHSNGSIVQIQAQALPPHSGRESEHRSDSSSSKKKKRRVAPTFLSTL